MRSYLIAAAAAVSIVTPVTAQEQVGRYQIVMSPTTLEATFLLDTVTGQVWHFVVFSDVQGDPKVWQAMPRLDSWQKTKEFIDALGRKESAPLKRP